MLASDGARDEGTAIGEADGTRDEGIGSADLDTDLGGRDGGRTIGSAETGLGREGSRFIGIGTGET